MPRSYSVNIISGNDKPLVHMMIKKFVTNTSLPPQVYIGIPTDNHSQKN